MGVSLRTRLLTMGIAALLVTSAAPAAAQLPLDTGRIVGTLTKNDGTPVGNARVSLTDYRGYGAGETRTNADGAFVIPNLWAEPGENLYKVSFFPGDLGEYQYAFRKRTLAEADYVQVLPGQDTVVNDALFPTGSIKVTASDALTGAPLSEFCARASRRGCTENGLVVLPEVSLGDQEVEVSSADYFLGHSRVTVVADQVAETHVKLAPAAKISTTVVDAVTKAPVENICIYPKEGIDSFGEYISDCSGPDGRVEINYLTTGDYNLWVEARDGVHGTQWLGPRGGTGSRLQAKVIHATAGQLVDLPPILLDKAGSISGTVVDRTTGAPVAGVCAFPRAGHAYGGGPEDRPSCTKQDGKYTISGLGPYHWPVNFIDNYPGTHAWQWSGDQPSQLTAKLIKVHAGQTATENARLAEGNTVSGKVTATGASGYLKVYNAITGDAVGDNRFLDENGNYELKNIAGNQPVKVRYSQYNGQSYDSHWYKNAEDFGSARPILVRPGVPVTGIDFVIQSR
jgi:hypothetical protein